MKPYRASRLAVGLLSSTLMVGVGAAAAAAQTYTVLHSFTGGADGGVPTAGVVQDSQGNVYGTTSNGGASCPAQSQGCGTLYKVAPDGTFRTLVTFNGATGAGARNQLTLIGQTLYGSTQYGGANNFGLLFSVQTDGTAFAILHSFRGSDGSYPVGNLRLGPDRVGYGITSAGGPANQGVLFAISARGGYKVLHSFSGADGDEPNSIVADATGNVFGATDYGGGGGCGLNLGCGVVFEYVAASGTFTVLNSFTGSSAVEVFPELGAIAADGTLYGATAAVGPGSASGTLFTLATTGARALTTLVTFDQSNGAVPYGPQLNADGSLTGQTLYGGMWNSGTLYRFAAGVLTTTYTFGPGYILGTMPEGQPITTPSGKIIGTTLEGGDEPCTLVGTQDYDGCGVLYRFKP